MLAGASYTWTAPQVNAYSFLAGDKYLILKADSYRQLAEWEEADNVLVQSITLTESDLAVSASSASGVAAVVSRSTLPGPFTTWVRLKHRHLERPRPAIS